MRTLTPSPDAGEELQAGLEERVTGAMLDELMGATDCPEGCVAPLVICEDCHGTGEKHPTGRGYMSHEIRDCETCGGSGEAGFGVCPHGFLSAARTEGII